MSSYRCVWKTVAEDDSLHPEMPTFPRLNGCNYCSGYEYHCEKMIVKTKKEGELEKITKDESTNK